MGKKVAYEAYSNLRDDLHREQMKLAQAQAKHAGELEKARGEHAKRVDAIIDALGLREAYPDERKEETVVVPQKVVNYYYTPNGYRYEHGGRLIHGGGCTQQLSPARTETVTKVSYGRDRFLADVKDAADAKRGAEALQRLTSALKKTGSKK